MNITKKDFRLILVATLVLTFVSFVVGFCCVSNSVVGCSLGPGSDGIPVVTLDHVLTLVLALAVAQLSGLL